MISPAKINPKIDGTLIFREMYGTKRIIEMMSVKIATGLDKGAMAKSRVISCTFYTHWGYPYFGQELAKIMDYSEIAMKK